MENENTLQPAENQAATVVTAAAEPSFAPRTDFARLTAQTEAIRAEIGKIIVGQSELLELLLTAVLAWAAWHARVGEALYGGVWTLAGADLHPLVLLFALSGTLMISKTLHVPKL